MSAKLFNCTPAQLPADLKANLVTMLQCGVNALEGYIRPGCVHLVRVRRGAAGVQGVRAGSELGCAGRQRARVCRQAAG